MQIAVYPGSFDPCTCGHLDIIKRASKLFDKVIVAILINKKKTPAFSEEKRKEWIVKSIKALDIKNVEVMCFSGMLTEFVERVHADFVLKGLRAVTDFEYEFQMALTNKRLSKDFETLFIPTSAEYMFLSSSVVREVASYGGDLKDLVPDAILNEVQKKYYLNQRGSVPGTDIKVFYNRRI